MKISDIDLNMFVKVTNDSRGLAQVIGFGITDVQIKFVKTGEVADYFASYLYKDAECSRAFHTWRLKAAISIGNKKK